MLFFKKVTKEELISKAEAYIKGKASEYGIDENLLSGDLSQYTNGYDIGVETPSINIPPVNTPSIDTESLIENLGKDEMFKDINKLL